MKKSKIVPFAAGLTLLASQTFPQAALSSGYISQTERPELGYLKAVNSVAPVSNPQLLFLLMAQYSNANLQREGADFITHLLERYQSQLTKGQRAMYLSCIAVLRAQSASSIALPKRAAYVKRSIDMLKEARELSGNKSFPINYLSGVVLAQLPRFFHQNANSEEMLNWCQLHASEAPHPGWMREVYFNLAKLALRKGQERTAKQYLRLSGYESFDRPVPFLTAFAEDKLQGHRFGAPSITEAVPGRVYVLSGFEFTEYYFVVSDDRKQLFAIDAGSRPDSAKTAYEALLARNPGLPPLTIVFITHSHWDHIGGHSAFRALNPLVKFFARDKGAEEMDKEMNTPEAFEKHFFGERFNIEDVHSFRPDELVSSKSEMTIGGTRLQLIPIRGGETDDAMLVNLPDLGVLFVGDFIMPYVGAPFVSEGSVQGMLDAIDVVAELKPKILLHGHRALTANFGSTELLLQLKAEISWLREQVLVAIRRGDDVSAIQNANLIPPDLLAGKSIAQLQYLIMREHLIDRLYNQNTGYWHADLKDVNHVSRSQSADTLFAYLQISPSRIRHALQELLKDGKYEQAADLFDLVEEHKLAVDSRGLIKRKIYLELMQKYQDTDPFKFILYASKIGQQVPLIPATDSKEKQ